jgi:S-adenosylmethionine synthetase
MNVDVDVLALPAPDALPLEIIERRGIGHADTI